MQKKYGIDNEPFRESRLNSRAASEACFVLQVNRSLAIVVDMYFII